MSILPVRKPVISGEAQKSRGLGLREYLELKIGVHRELLKYLDLEKLASPPDDNARREVHSLIED